MILVNVRNLALLMLGGIGSTWAQGGELQLPKQIVAGAPFSIPTQGTGKAVLYFVGLGQVLQQNVELGSPATVTTGVLYSAGFYAVALVGKNSTMTGQLEVIPAPKVEVLGFLAKPSRLPVGLHNGISGAIYTFDAYNNLITAPTQATFELSNLSGGNVQTRTVTTRNGLAWIEMDSAAKEGRARFIARDGSASSTRVIEQVPGDPCGINITARQSGNELEVQTAPVRDCTGNAIPDGTIVTFTETYDGVLTTVDAPLKQGVAKVNMPARSGSRISAASGVVAGNEIRWGGER
jgi:hypothetical protein